MGTGQARQSLAEKHEGTLGLCRFQGSRAWGQGKACLSASIEFIWGWGVGERPSVFNRF